jgi:hypothetical protein
MRPSEITEAGYKIEQYVPIGASAEMRRKPWMIRHLRHGPYGARYATRAEALAALTEELSHPDSTWPRDLNG